jgi:putative ABC transport system permease protein
MIMASSWIALRTLPSQRSMLFWHAVAATLLGGGGVLIIMIWPVLDVKPLYKSQVIIPLAGMIFANSMNTISLAMERLDAELNNQLPYLQARKVAFNAALIPIINSLFAVGLVSLPGMMTGQVLAGVSPLVAVRYQVIVMCMIFASAALSTACILISCRKFFDK